MQNNVNSIRCISYILWIRVADPDPGVLVGSGFRKESDPDLVSTVGSGIRLNPPRLQPCSESYYNIILPFRRFSWEWGAATSPRNAHFSLQFRPTYKDNNISLIPDQVIRTSGDCLQEYRLRREKIQIDYLHLYKSNLSTELNSIKSIWLIIELYCIPEGLYDNICRQPGAPLLLLLLFVFLRPDINQSLKKNVITFSDWVFFLYVKVF